jgi:hypothetical protein
MTVSQYKRIETIKRDVNTKRFNKIVLKRKLRLASFVDAPILRKGFHNNPRLVVCKKD